MKVYDNYEISGCHRLDDAGRPDPNGAYTETCADSEARFWTLYGHINGEGVEAIGNFKTREAAERVYASITGLPFTGSYRAEPRLRVMHTGPKLLEALITCANLLADYDEADGCEGDAWREAIAVIEEARAGATSEPRKPIVIEVLGGVVQDVQNVPPGYVYEVKDYDDIGADEEVAGRPA
jgi:hypothetical protein